ncbi:hypothetical protein D3C73_982250 [compost metagenome]
MVSAVQHVRTGQVTYAVRDTVFDDLNITAGHYIGIADSKIVSTEEGLIETSQGLLSKMLSGGDEIVTIFVGEEASKEVTESLVAWIQEIYPDVEVEVHDGGQPIYYYLFSVES